MSRPATKTRLREQSSPSGASIRSVRPGMHRHTPLRPGQKRGLHQYLQLHIELHDPVPHKSKRTLESSYTYILNTFNEAIYY